MLGLLKELLQQLINDIDSGNSNISEKEQLEAIEFIQRVQSKELSKIESAEYIGVSRATFDNYIRDNKIPRGHKRPGFKELSWNKCDLDKFLKDNK